MDETTPGKGQAQNATVATSPNAGTGPRADWLKGPDRAVAAAERKVEKAELHLEEAHEALEAAKAQSEDTLARRSEAAKEKAAAQPADEETD